MKVCPQCETGFPDTLTTCPTHGGLLSEIRDLKPGMVVHQSYRIVRKLGQGGMGTVYLARHTLMDEPVALKFLSPELSADTAFTNRFLREVRTLRQVRHRNVVDANSLEPAEDGSLFFSMEYVEGPDLRELISQKAPFEVALALEITRGIAEGLGAAHAKGMVHRDIKPENILLTQENGHWIPKIADFGIVATKENSITRTRTGSGSLLTWAYAAPEQWRGMKSAQLDGRTDIYALGGVLFEMLTGHTVFDEESYEGWAEQHKNATPSCPSSLRPELVHWKGLDELVLRLLEKDRERRPADIAQLSEQLSTITKGTVASQLPKREQRRSNEPKQTEVELPPPQPVNPRPEPSRPELSSNAGRRGFLISLGASLVLIGLCIVSILAWQSRQSSDAQGQTPLLHTFPVNQSNAVAIAYSPDGNTLASDSLDTIYLWDSTSGQLLRTLKGHNRLISSIAFSPDGRILASGGYDKTLELWDLANGQLLRTLKGHSRWVRSVAFSPDGRTLASGSGDDTIKLWDAVSGQLLRTLQWHWMGVNSVVFSPDGHMLASGSYDKTIRLWDVTSGQLLRTLQEGSDVLSVAFSPDGHTLASGGKDGTIKLWDVASGQMRLTLQGHSKGIKSVAFSPGGRTLVSSSDDYTISLWDTVSGKRLRTLRKNSLCAAFSPDGQTLASGARDHTINLWDVSHVNK